MKIQDIMSMDVCCVSPDTSLSEAAKLMKELDVGALPVCANDRLTGMLTDRDIVVRGLARSRDPREATARDAMTPEVVYIYDDQAPEEAARLLQARQIRRLPVLNREKRMVGIVSLGDLAVKSGPTLGGAALEEISHSAQSPDLDRAPAAWKATGELANAKLLEGHALSALDGVIGQVKDFYFDDRHWRVRYCVVETGQWLRRRRVLIAPEVIGAYDAERKVFPVGLTTEQVRNSPDIDTDKPISRQREEALRSYYGWSPYYFIGEGATIAPMPLPSSERSPGAEAVLETKGDHHLRSTHATTGYDIAALDGPIGHVEDFLIDSLNWRILYVVIDTTNWWPGKKVAVPVASIARVSWSKSEVAIELTRDAIKAGPAYVGGALVDRAYSVALHDYYEGLRMAARNRT